MLRSTENEVYGRPYSLLMTKAEM